MSLAIFMAMEHVCLRSSKGLDIGVGPPDGNSRIAEGWSSSATTSTADQSPQRPSRLFEICAMLASHLR